MRLTREGVTVTEIAPGVDLERDVLAQAEFPLRVAERPDEDGRRACSIPRRSACADARPARRGR